MYTVDPGTVRPQEKVGGVTVAQTPTSVVSLLAVMGVVAVIVAAVVAIVLLVGGPAAEVHDSWMNVPVASVSFAADGVHDSWMATGVVSTFEIHDSWMTTGS